MIDDHVPELSGIIFSDINLTKKGYHKTATNGSLKHNSSKKTR